MGRGFLVLLCVLLVGQPVEAQDPTAADYLRPWMQGKFSAFDQLDLSRARDARQGAQLLYEVLQEIGSLPDRALVAEMADGVESRLEKIPEEHQGHAVMAWAALAESCATRLDDRDRALGLLHVADYLLREFQDRGWWERRQSRYPEYLYYLHSIFTHMHLAENGATAEEVARHQFTCRALELRRQELKKRLWLSGHWSYPDVDFPDFSDPDLFAVRDPEPEDEAVRPRLLSLPAADYPEMYRRQRIQGEVVVKVLVGRDGKVEQTSILKSLHPELDKLCLEAAARAEFTPGRRGDTPVRAWMAIPFTFRLATED